MNELLEKITSTTSSLDKTPRPQRKEKLGNVICFGGGCVKCLLVHTYVCIAVGEREGWRFTPDCVPHSSMTTSWWSFSWCVGAELIDSDMKKAKKLIELMELELRSVPPAERNQYKAVCIVIVVLLFAGIF